MTKAELLESIDAGLLIEARNGLLRLRFTDVEAQVTAAHASVQVRLVDMDAQPVNTHPAGTFLWAAHEYGCGRRVACGKRTFVPGPKYSWPDQMFLGAEFYSTDWRVV